jgi:hypothetical protein
MTPETYQHGRGGLNMPAKSTAKSPVITLSVTQELIDTARTRDSNHCMIAEALKAARPDARKIAVDLATIRFTDGKRHCRYTYLTPRTAQVCLVNFDQGRPPEPFQFRLRGAHVTRAGAATAPRKSDMSDAERTAREAAGERLGLAQKRRAELRRSRLVPRNGTHADVPDRVGGKAPPLQKGKDDVPFSRRRAFGLRALEL